MKSIIIFGKGPSLLKYTRDIVDSYDDIALCNYPVLNDFFYNLIKNHISLIIILLIVAHLMKDIMIILIIYYKFRVFIIQI